MIVSLGGNGISRLNKAISLVEKNYTKNNIIIVTGYEGTNRTKENNIPDARLDIIKDLKNKNIKFILNPDLKNTAEEIIFVKKYMKNNDLKDVTFVTEPPHSRRILLLANILVKGDTNDFRYKIISYDTEYWDSNKYYKNNKAKEYALLEFIKIIYNLTYYSLFSNLEFVNYFEKDLEELKSEVSYKIKNLSN